MSEAAQFPVRRAKVGVITVYADRFRQDIEPLAFGLRALGHSETEIEDRLEELRPAFRSGVEDLLLQVTVMALKENVVDDGWAELSVDLLRQSLDKPGVNPAMLVKGLAQGLRIMEETGVYERDGKLYVPGSSSHVVSVGRSEAH